MSDTTAMTPDKNLKDILTKLQYRDDAKVVEQITAQMRQVQDRMAGIKYKLVGVRRFDSLEKPVLRCPFTNGALR